MHQQSTWSLLGVVLVTRLESILVGEFGTWIISVLDNSVETQLSSVVAEQVSNKFDGSVGTLLGAEIGTRWVLFNYLLLF